MKNQVKQKIIMSTGATSTFLGGTGAALAGAGLCGCTLAPILSLAGIATILVSFLTYYKIPFLTVGIALLLVSFILYKKKKTCKIHKKHNP